MRKRKLLLKVVIEHRKNNTSDTWEQMSIEVVNERSQAAKVKRI